MAQQTLPTYNAGYDRLFGDEDGLSLGLFFPIEAVESGKPAMENQVELAQRAEGYGFDALWFRDVPLWDPSFGDAGQLYETFTYLGYIAAQTDEIALATGSVVLPLRHPLHVAKQAASVDQLSGGRFVMGVASGDRPVEFPAFGVDAESRGERFRESYRVFKQALEEDFPTIDSECTTLNGNADLVPKSTGETIPLLVTGHARQDRDWIAANGDGWLYYTQDFATQEALLKDWQNRVAEQVGDDVEKPFAMSEHVTLAENPDAAPRQIHQGVELGRNALVDRLERWNEIGVDHLALNLRYNDRPAGDVLDELGSEVLPALSSTLSA